VKTLHNFPRKAENHKNTKRFFVQKKVFVAVEKRFSAEAKQFFVIFYSFPMPRLSSKLECITVTANAQLLSIRSTCHQASACK
jgi:hypothetical protein